MIFHNDSTRPSAGSDTDSTQPNARRSAKSSPAVPAPRGSSTGYSHASTPEVAARSAPLTTSKVLAGGMAASTSAVLGSYFGVFGTVGGAAAGSVATMVSTTIYQRSIERTRNSLRARVGRSSQSRPTVTPTATQSRHLPRPFIAALIGTLVIFAVGIGLVTGIELIRGGPLSGGNQGTSMGRVLQPLPAVPPGPADQSRRGRNNQNQLRDPDTGRTQSQVPGAPGGLGGLLPTGPRDPNESSRHDPPSQSQAPGGLGGLLPSGSQDPND
jgi:hypothetical protein